MRGGKRCTCPLLKEENHDLGTGRKERESGKTVGLAQYHSSSRRVRFHSYLAYHDRASHADCALCAVEGPLLHPRANEVYD